MLPQDIGRKDIHADDIVDDVIEAEIDEDEYLPVVNKVEVVVGRE